MPFRFTVRMISAASIRLSLVKLDVVDFNQKICPVTPNFAKTWQKKSDNLHEDLTVLKKIQSNKFCATIQRKHCCASVFRGYYVLDISVATSQTQGKTLVFPLQQRLHECVTTLRYTCNVVLYSRNCVLGFHRH